MKLFQLKYLSIFTLIILSVTGSCTQIFEGILIYGVVSPLYLVTNSLLLEFFKYDFQNKNQLEIKTEIKIYFNKCQNDEFFLEIFDNGVRLPQGFTANASQFLGLQLVETIIAHLNRVRKFILNEGTLIKIKFKDEKSFRIYAV